MNIVQEKRTLKNKINQSRKVLRESIKKWNHKYGNFIDSAPKLGIDHLKSCRMLPDRYELLNYLPKNSVVCEVGTNKGAFAREIIKTTSPLELHIIDISFNNFEHTKFRDIDLNSVAKTYESDSVECLSNFPDNYFDWIYIDGDHSYEGVQKDLNISKRKVKQNGYIVCNDYTSWSPSSVSKCGVAKAVNQFCINESWQFIFFALQSNMYCDVVLKKM